MTDRRYRVLFRKHRADLEFSERGELVVVRFEGRSQQVKTEEAGSKLWGMIREAGIGPHEVEMVAVREDDERQALVATVHPVLTGAHVTWLTMTRADAESSCFRQLGSHHRAPDALDEAFRVLKREIVLPHKP